MTEPDLPSSPTVEWRGFFENNEVNRLHAECFKHALTGDDWVARVNSHSLGWVSMRTAGRLVGFVNVAWDGGVHAFLLDTMVAAVERHQGHATALVAEAIRQASATGSEWLHVDFEPHLRGFYLDSCGFKTTDAGLVALRCFL